MITGKRKCPKRIIRGREDFFKSSDLSSGVHLYQLNAKHLLGDACHMLHVSFAISPGTYIFQVNYHHKVLQQNSRSAKTVMASLVSLETSLSLPTWKTVISWFPFIVLHNPNYNDKPISKPYVSDFEIKTKCRIAVLQNRRFGRDLRGHQILLSTHWRHGLTQAVSLLKPESNLSTLPTEVVLPSGAVQNRPAPSPEWTWPSGRGSALSWQVSRPGLPKTSGHPKSSSCMLSRTPAKQSGVLLRYGLQRTAVGGLYIPLAEYTAF